MANTRVVKVRIQVDFYTDGSDASQYRENLVLYPHKGTDHIEALALVVTEIAHFERGLRKTLAMGIPEDAAPAEAG